MVEQFVSIFASVLIVSLISLIGLFVFFPSGRGSWIIYLISFAAGALFGDVFLHLLPEVAESGGFGVELSSFVLVGILLFFILEKGIHWQHCHGQAMGEHVHPFAYVNLIGDGLHNLIDGIIIAASYLVSFPVGLATTIAVVLHEIPQEIGDFAILIYSGFSKRKALLLNFASALLAFLGAGLTFWAHSFIGSIDLPLTLIAAGGFLYLAGSDLIPELHKHSRSFVSSLAQVVVFLLGIGVMALLLLI